MCGVFFPIAVVSDIVLKHLIWKCLKWRFYYHHTCPLYSPN